jgi:hypothetical protein
VALDDCYIGVDDDPAPLADVVAWLREYMGVTEWSDEQRVRRTGSKRCSNARAKALGWVPQYPSYKEGYAAILEGKLIQAAALWERPCSGPQRPRSDAFAGAASPEQAAPRAARFSPSPAPTAACRQPARHFIRLGAVHRLEDLQGVAIALEDPRRTTLVALQPHAVVAAAHGRAIARQAHGEAVNPRQAGDVAGVAEAHGVPWPWPSTIFQSPPRKAWYSAFSKLPPSGHCLPLGAYEVLLRLPG